MCPAVPNKSASEGRPSRPPKLKLINAGPAYDSSPAPAVVAAALVGASLDWTVTPAVGAAGVTEWERLARTFRAEPGRFTEGDRAALSAYCTFWADFIDADRDIQERGGMVPGRSSADEASDRLVKNPSVAAKREASQQLRLWAVQLGLTPGSRARIQSQHQGSESDDGNPF